MTERPTVEIRPEGSHYLVTRAGAQWRFNDRAGAERFAERLKELPADARPLGWPTGMDLAYDRER